MLTSPHPAPSSTHRRPRTSPQRPSIGAKDDKDDDGSESACGEDACSMKRATTRALSHTTAPVALTRSVPSGGGGGGCSVVAVIEEVDDDEGGEEGVAGGESTRAASRGRCSMRKVRRTDDDE